MEEILTAYLGFEHIGLAPNFYKAVEKDDKDVNRRVSYEL